MPTTKYQWSTMGGTYLVDCCIKDKIDGQYVIEFFDDFINETVERVVKQDEITFPSFGEMVMC